MNSRERIETIFRHETPDRASGVDAPELTDADKAYFEKKYGADFVTTHTGDMVCPWPAIPFPASPFTMTGDIPWYHDPIINDDYSNIDDLEMPDPEDPVYLEVLDKAIRENPGKAIFYVIVGPITHLHGMRQMSNIYLDAYTCPEGLYEMLSRIWNVSFRILNRVLDSGRDISGVFVMDDIAAQKSLLFSPKMLDKFLFGFVEQATRLVKSRGKFLMYHSDGNLMEIMPRLIELGFDAVNPMQPGCNDMEAFKRLYGRKMVCCGALDNTYVLHRGTPDDIRAHIRTLHETVGKDGGLIYSCSMIDPSMSHENRLALYEATQTCYY